MADTHSYEPPKTYPHVAQKSDPLVIRFDKLSMLVGDCNFYAKVETGQMWQGFKVFVSGIGNSVYQKQMNGAKSVTTSMGVVNVDTSAQKEQIAQEASNWLDTLESAIVDSKSESGVAEQIEALRWQMHYDITKTSAEVPDTVTIDKADTIKDFSEATTLAISTMDDNLSDATTGSIIGVTAAITTLDESLTDSTTGAIPAGVTAITTSISAVSSSLRGDGEYTISKCLRDSATSDNSVSYSTYQQTQLESTEFGNLSSDIGGVQSSVTGISTNLGTASDSGSTNTINGKINSIKSSVGVSTDTTTATLFGYNKVLNDNISSSGSSSAGDITTIKTNVNTIMTRMGSATDSRNANTLGGKINDVNAKLGDTTTAGNIWWDVLHNAGTSPNTAGYDTNSVVDKIIQAVSA